MSVTLFLSVYFKIKVYVYFSLFAFCSWFSSSVKNAVSKSSLNVLGIQNFERHRRREKIHLFKTFLAFHSGTIWPWIKARILSKSHSVILLCWSVDWSVNSLPNFRILLSRLAMVKFLAYSGLSFDTNLRFFLQNSKLWKIFN